MNRFIVAFAALALSSAPAWATPQWTVDHGKSKLGFAVQWSGEAFAATFKSWKADIAFDPADLAHSHVTVLIDVGSEASAFPDNDEGLKGPQGFDPGKFPTAKFEAAKFTHGQGNAYVADGTLSLHGVTKHITLPFTLTITGNTAHMVGKAVLARPDFGLAQGEFSGETPIAHAVTVNVDLTASKP
ncbi:MAG TPA: YceI family protein [Rhizomicrobium sp.]|jgi:polyisoprenoid-binding protein YceI